jgi:hypothetical protein
MRRRFLNSVQVGVERESSGTTVTGLVYSFGTFRHENDYIFKNGLSKKGVENF